MSYLRHLNKILLTFIFIINLYVSFDHFISQNTLPVDYNIELLVNENGNNLIDFNKLKLPFLLYESVISYKKAQRFNHQINNLNSLEQLKFDTQKHTVLNFKPILLQIAIHEILIQKSHCI